MDISFLPPELLVIIFKKCICNRKVSCDLKLVCRRWLNIINTHIKIKIIKFNFRNKKGCYDLTDQKSYILEFHYKNHILFDSSEIDDDVILQFKEVSLLDLSFHYNIEGYNLIKFKKLVSLDLSHISNLVHENVGLLSDLPYLIELRLKGKNIPDCYISDLTNLELLDISENFSFIGHGLLSLTKLRELNISDGKICSVFISELTNLTKLNVSSNENFYSENLVLLTKLKKIILKFNKNINGKPLGVLTNLEHLNLACSSISDGKFISNLVKLEHLDLFGCGEVYDRHITTLTNLKKLHASGTNNKITIEGIKKLTNLEHLVCHHNNNIGSKEISRLRENNYSRENGYLRINSNF